MQASEVSRAVVAAMSVASSLGLTVDDVIVLHNSNRLTVRLLPCDVLARVAAVAHQVAQFEVELAQRLAESGCPVATLEPRVAPRLYESDGFVVTLWTYYEPAAPAEASPADYATALERVHAGMHPLVRPSARAGACRHPQARLLGAALHRSRRPGPTTRGQPRPQAGARRRGPGAARRHVRRPETRDWRVWRC